MYFKSKTISFLLLGSTSFICSKVFFSLLDDPEGPNLFIVAVLAGVMFTLSLLGYTSHVSASSFKRLLFGMVIQMITAIFLYVLLDVYTLKTF